MFIQSEGESESIYIRKSRKSSGAVRMAENGKASEKNGCGKETMRTLMRRLSLKKKGSEVASTDGTVLNTSPSSSDTQNLKTATTEDGFIWTIWRKSFRSHSKKMYETYKSIPEYNSTASTAMDKKNTNFSFTYDIMPSHLSVMEINGLIESEDLKEAYLNILSLKKDVQCEKETLGEEASSVKLSHKEKDVNLLYKNLRDKLESIVHQSCTQPSCNKELMLQVAGIIQDNEMRKGDEEGTEGLGAVWRTAIQKGVKDTLRNSYLNSNKQTVSCVEAHLDYLGKKIVKLLETVKEETLNVYPQSFLVFDIYAASCHEFLGEHLKMLLEKATELKDYNDIMDFVIHRYHSKMILSSPTLQPEMKEQTFLLSDDLLSQIKKAYCDCLHETLHASLENLIDTEQKEVWTKKVTPKNAKDKTFYSSEIYTNICEMVKKYSDNCANFDKNMEKMAICKCLEALKPFPKRFEEEFSKQNRFLLGSDLLDCCLWAEYHIAYINSFSSLKEHIDNYREKCPGQVKALELEVDELTDHLRQALLEQFSVEIKPYLSHLMTKNWLNTDTEFNELVNRIEIYSGYSKSMRHPSAQFFASDMHYHVVKVYISELLRNKYSCKGKKNEDAAAKMKEQWTALKKLFSEMGSSLDWLHSLGYDISKIIEQEHEKDIKNVLTPLVEKYPDISKRQLAAILYFRDNSLKLERSPAIQYFTELKRKIDNRKTENTEKHKFFSDIEKVCCQFCTASEIDKNDVNNIHTTVQALINRLVMLKTLFRLCLQEKNETTIRRQLHEEEPGRKYLK